jgi:hypothetical protein
MSEEIKGEEFEEEAEVKDGSQAGSENDTGDADQVSGEDAGDADQEEDEQEAESVPVSAIIKMRRQNRETKNLLQEVRAENKRLRDVVEAFANKSGEPEDDEDEDDLVTKADLKKILKQIPQPQNNIREQMIHDQTVRFASEHEDFSNVLQYTRDLVSDNPGLEAKIMAHPNPAAEAYRIGKTHPDYAEENPVKKRKPVKKKEKVNTLTGSGGSTDKNQSEADYWLNMSDEDFEKERKRRLGLS